MIKNISILILLMTWTFALLAQDSWTNSINFGFTSFELNNSLYSANPNINPIIIGNDIFFITEELYLSKITKYDNSYYSNTELLVSTQNPARGNTNLVEFNNTICYINSDNKIHCVFQTNNNWSCITLHSDNQNSQTVRNDSRIVSDSDHGVFYIGEDDRIYLISFSTNQNFEFEPILLNQDIHVRANSQLLYSNNHIFYIGIDNLIHEIYFNGLIWVNMPIPYSSNLSFLVRPNSELVIDNQMNLYYISLFDNKIYKKSFEPIHTYPLNINQIQTRQNSNITLFNNIIYFIGVDNKVYSFSNGSSSFSNGQQFINPEALPVKNNSSLMINSKGIFYISQSNKVCYLIYDYIDNTRNKGWKFGLLNSAVTADNYLMSFPYSTDEKDIYFIDNNFKLKVLTRSIKNPFVHKDYGSPFFYDEFNGSYDYPYWHNIFGWGFRPPDGPSGNLAYTTLNGENLEFENGNIIINVKNEPAAYPVYGSAFGSCWYLGCDTAYYEYTTSMLNSTQVFDNEPTNFNFRYGYIEIRCKIPKCAKTGEGFWLTGDNAEIDIFEFMGSQHLSMNNWGNSNLDGVSKGFKERPIGYRFHDDFYTFGLKWESQKLTWYLNNEIIAEYNEDESLEVTDNNLRIYITSRVWDYSPGYYTVDNIIENIPNEFIIDYVRVYNIENEFSINETENKSIKIFPNPCNNVLNIQTSEEINLKIIGLNGKSLLAYNNIKSTPIDVSSFSDGIYFIIIENSNYSFVEKIIITH